MRNAMGIRLALSLCFGLAAGLVILLTVLADPSGRITPDSAQYLALADNILAGNGMTLADEARGRAGREAFAIWPVGYPALIAAVAWATGVPVLLASKLLNIGFLLACMMLVSASFGRSGFALSLVVIFGAYLELFSFTWSEAPFLFLALLACFLAGRVLQYPFDGADPRLAGLGLAVLGMFMVRYVGAAALALPMALVLADMVSGRRRRALFGAAIVVLVGAAILAYLLRNAALTGHMTGIERVAAPETHGELVRQLSIALLREAVLPLAEWQPSDWLHLAFVGVQVLAALVALPWLVRGLRQDRPGPAFDALTRVLLLSGAGYLVFIIAIRWLAAFDGFGFRLLAPGSLLIFLGLFRALMERIPGAARKVEGFLTVVAAMSLIAIGLNAFGHGTTLSQQMRAEMARYAIVPEGAVLVFAGLHAPFLRSDLHISAPNPFSASGLPEDSESWSDFLASLDPDCPVWLDTTGAPAPTSTHHPSVLDALEGLPTGALIELRAPVTPAT